MKKITLCTLLAFFICSFASAYNPPVSGDNYCELASPKGLTGASSVVGGAIFSAGPDSVSINPAIAAGEQRVMISLADSFMWSTNTLNKQSTGNALQAGLLIPSKLYIFSGLVNLTTVPFNEMPLGNSLNIKAGLSKEISEKLDVGLSLSGGAHWFNGNDWSLCGNLGFVYNYGDLAFMKNFRYGASLLNLGKNYKLPEVYGAKQVPSATFPTIATLKLGCAASLFKNDTAHIAYSFDLTIPAFQNLIIDAGLQFALKDMLVLSVAEKINLVESINGAKNYIPSVGLAFKFSFDVNNVEYLQKKDWSQSEMNVSAAYKKLYESVNIASAGVDVILGMQDTSAPVFDETLFEVEEE